MKTNPAPSLRASPCPKGLSFGWGRLAARFSLMTAALIGAVVLSVAITVIRSQKGLLELESRERLDTVMDGVARIAQESIDASDELMLISYLKHLRRDRPELALAEVTRRGRTSTLGAPAPPTSSPMAGGTLSLQPRPRPAPRLITLTRTAVERVAVTYTVKTLPSGDQAPEVSVSSAGLNLKVPGDAVLTRTEERKPLAVVVRLGFLEDSIQSEISRRLEPMVRRIGAIAATFMALGWLGAFYLGKLLTNPISALTLAVGAVGRGKLDTTVAEDRGDEVGLLEHTFNEMTTRIKELVDQREDVLHTLTHELNTPLAGLKGYLELWGDRKLPPEAQAEVLGTMTAAVLRMEGSLGNALRLFKGPAGQGAGPRKVVWVDDVFTGVLAILAPVASSKKIAVHPLPSEASDFVVADEDTLRQVVSNLVSNAFKYTPEGGEVRLGLESGEGEVRFWVADTGRGIAPEDLPHIFTKFYRGSRPAEGSADPGQRIPGSGLGLSIAHKAVTSMGGSIRVESEPGKGSKFIISLPRVPAQTEARQETP
ncbi:MAG: HAMP domain-containing protein [Elusimicrobia bacterium]|nr:HAMP domain-containing protein [Elusimicrobiota bacterium]